MSSLTISSPAPTVMSFLALATITKSCLLSPLPHSTVSTDGVSSHRCYHGIICRHSSTYVSSAMKCNHCQLSSLIKMENFWYKYFYIIGNLCENFQCKYLICTCICLFHETHYLRTFLRLRYVCTAYIWYIEYSRCCPIFHRVFVQTWVNLLPNKLLTVIYVIISSAVAGDPTSFPIPLCNPGHATERNV